MNIFAAAFDAKIVLDIVNGGAQSKQLCRRFVFQTHIWFTSIYWVLSLNGNIIFLPPVRFIKSVSLFSISLNVIA